MIINMDSVQIYFVIMLILYVPLLIELCNSLRETLLGIFAGYYL